MGVTFDLAEDLVHCHFRVSCDNGVSMRTQYRRKGCHYHFLVGRVDSHSWLSRRCTTTSRGVNSFSTLSAKITIKEILTSLTVSRPRKSWLAPPHGVSSEKTTIQTEGSGGLWAKEIFRKVQLEPEYRVEKSLTACFRACKIGRNIRLLLHTSSSKVTMTRRSYPSFKKT